VGAINENLLDYVAKHGIEQNILNINEFVAVEHTVS
jgi:hypothetical protein